MRGGARAGAGRPVKENKKIYKTVSISGSPEEIEALKKIASDSGKTLSRYIIDLILK